MQGSMSNDSQIEPKEMRAEEVLNLLHSGEFEELRGVVETQAIEFKGAPYVLDSRKNKLELAKDLSGLANAGGGVLVMGVGTCVLEGHPREAAERIRSFAAERVNVKQYEDVLADWVYPRLNVEIRWVESASDKGKGLVYVRIPESQVARKPFLTVHVLHEDDRMLGNVVGFFQRRGDKVAHWSAEELHHVFKDGLRFDDHLSDINETLGKLLSGAKTKESVRISPEALNQRIENAIQAVGLTDRCSYVLASCPDVEVEIRGLFESSTSDMVKLIDGPPRLRYAGFDIATGEGSKIVNGELRRSILKPYKVLEVWRDGTVIFVTNGDEGFLCWGDYNSDKFLRVNSIALVESVYLFALFARNVYEGGNVPDCPVTMRLELHNILETKPYGLSKCRTRSGWAYAETDLKQAKFKSTVLEQKFGWRHISPEVWAYKIVGDFYAKFGLEHQFVPYTKGENGTMAIDPERIRNIR